MHVNMLSIFILCILDIDFFFAVMFLVKGISKTIPIIKISENIQYDLKLTIKNNFGNPIQSSAIYLFFWYLVKIDLSRVRYCTRVHTFFYLLSTFYILNLWILFYICTTLCQCLKYHMYIIYII